MRFLLLALLLVSCSAYYSGQNYSLVLVGGGLYDNNTAIWDTIVALGGGKGVARFGVVSAASEDPCCDDDSSWVYYQNLLTQYGAAEVYFINVTLNNTENNANEDIVNHVKTLTGFFFGGGDQLRIIKSFYNYNEKVPSPVLQAIKETLLATGGVVAGTSAGTDCQTGNVMISGGESYTGVVKGAEITWEPIEYPNPSVLTGYGPGGIALFPHGLVDTHFANRGRHGRLVQLLLDSAALPRGNTRAFGMDENTALVVTGAWDNRQAEVVGQRGAWVFSTTDAVRSVDGHSVEGVTVSRLSAGDVISLNTYKITPAAYKSPLISQEVAAETSDNIFGEDVFEFDRIALSLLQSALNASTWGTTPQRSPQVTVTLSKDQKTGSVALSRDRSSGDAVVVGYGGVNPESKEFSYCFSGLHMSMVTA